jgi:DNA-binding NarL/FixJ family response regulator
MEFWDKLELSIITPSLIDLSNPARVLSIASSHDIIFGSGNYYEAYLFALFHRSIESNQFVGAGCTEEEVEALAKSCRRACGLLVTDCVAGGLGDAGEQMVERIKEWNPKSLAILIASERGEMLLSQGRLDVYDGIISIHSVNRGGILKAVEYVFGGKGPYRDSTLRTSKAERGVKFSARERQVLALLAKGMTNKEIASALFIAEVTARDYVSSIYRKTETGNRAEAAAWATRHGYC